jgi:hypothetical protein
MLSSNRQPASLYFPVSCAARPSRSSASPIPKRSPVSVAMRDSLYPGHTNVIDLLRLLCLCDGLLKLTDIEYIGCIEVPAYRESTIRYWSALGNT